MTHPSPGLEKNVEEALAAMVRAGQEAWPELSLPAPLFVEYLKDRLEPDQDILESLQGLRARDLYLACACSRGDARAISTFERSYLAAIDPLLERMGISASSRDEAKQVLRHRFFVAEQGKAPRIVDYSGRGDLQSWVRVSAVRAAVRIARKTQRLAGARDALLEAIAAPAQDLELNFLKRTYGKAFEVALGEAFDSLPVRDRNLLRYYFGKGLSIDDLSVLYRIHRATAARRLQKVSAELVMRTRNHLAVNLGISGADVSSLLRLVQSEIERTLSGILAAADRTT